MRSALVTGAAGFIGSNLCRHLLSLGYRVTGVDSFHIFYPRILKELNLNYFRKHFNFTFFECDILNVRQLDVVFSQNRFDVVVHLAAIAGVAPSIVDPASYYRINVLGTLNILEQCKKFGVKKVVMASSSSVYGDTDKLPLAENNLAGKALSPYAASKKAMEELAESFSVAHKISIACIRYFTVYGPAQRPDMAVSLFTRKVSRGDKIVLYGSDTARNYTYIDDVVLGTIKIVEADFSFDIVNIGGSEVVSFTKLIREISDALGLEARYEMQTMPRQYDMKVTDASIIHAHDKYGYSPTICLHDGIKKYVSWYSGLRNVYDQLDNGQL